MRLPDTKVIHIMAITVVALLQSLGASAANAYEEYIARYADMAIEQMRAYGIPASITLAQGLLESGAGKSTLAREGNNHFGIKCHSDWRGETMLRNDDAPDECFRVYGNVADSFTDHSLFLRRKRYAELFDLDPSDYAGWARGLKKCGYATDPNYAARLISIIELYSLYRFDTGSFREAEETAAFIHESLCKTHVIRKNRGLHYVIAQPGDTYATIAKELKIKKSKLLRFNDRATDGEIKPWEEVYLQEKSDVAPDGISHATIGDGETIHSVAQRFGMKEEAVRRLNPEADDEPGVTLRLR